MSSVKKTLGELRAAARAKTPAAAAPPPAVRDVFQLVQRDTEKPEIIRFRLSPTHVTYANTLRRTMLTEVESVAFRADILDDGSTADVRILKNNAPMSNEMLAHRIGLIPIYVKNPLQWKPERYTFKLSVTNDSVEPRDVTAADIEVYEDRGPEEEPLRVANTQFFHPDRITKETCLLTVLKGRVGAQEPESLAFTAKATVGTGRENSRFMPVTSRCSYGYTLDKDPERQKDIFNNWLVSHKKASPGELDSDKKEALMREFNTMEIQRCYVVDEKGEPNSFDFTVESVGVQDPVYVVHRALELLQAKLLLYASLESGELPDGLRIVSAETRGLLFDFIFQREDHTLGNLLQTWLEQNHFDTEEITFVGYKVPHPLRDEMVLRVGVPDGKELTARAIVAKAAREAAQMFRTWRETWTKIAGASM